MPTLNISFPLKIVILSAILAFSSSCDGVREYVYNCNDFEVTYGDRFTQEFESGAFFITLTGGEGASRDQFRYPDGSVHIPKVIDPILAYDIQKRIPASDSRAMSQAICKKFGPGILLIG